MGTLPRSFIGFNKISHENISGKRAAYRWQQESGKGPRRKRDLNVFGVEEAATIGLSVLVYPFGLSVYRCVVPAAGVRPKTTARERCDGARVRPNPSYPLPSLLFLFFPSFFFFSFFSPIFSSIDSGNLNVAGCEGLRPGHQVGRECRPDPGSAEGCRFVPKIWSGSIAFQNKTPIAFRRGRHRLPSTHPKRDTPVASPLSARCYPRPGPKRHAVPTVSSQEVSDVV